MHYICDVHLLESAQWRPNYISIEIVIGSLIWRLRPSVTVK